MDAGFDVFASCKYFSYKLAEMLIKHIHAGSGSDDRTSGVADLAQSLHHRNESMAFFRYYRRQSWAWFHEDYAMQKMYVSMITLHPKISEHTPDRLFAGRPENVDWAEGVKEEIWR